MTHDPLCPLTPPTAEYEPYLAEAVRAIQQETPCLCDLIAKVRAECADVVASFDWSPETDHADIERLVAELRGEPYP